MGKQVKINPGFRSVLLPDGRLYDEGATSALTEAEYAGLDAGTLRAITLLGTVGEPARVDNRALVRADLASLALRSGARLVPWGDSTISADSSRYPATSYGARDFWAWGQMISGGAFQYVQNAGLAGDDSGEGLLRFTTDVAAYKPTIVPIVFGINDAVSGLSLATYQANIREMVRLVRSIGATPWLATISGNVNTGVVQQRIATYNLWLRIYAASEGIPLLDIAHVMTNPADGKITTGFDLDGTHQNAAGAKAIGQKVADLVARTVVPWVPPLPVSNTADSLNLAPNGLFLSGSPIPTSWVNTGGTPSIITGDAAIKGNWARLTDATITTANIRANVAGTGVAAGDVLRFVGRYRQVQGTSVTSGQLYLMLFGTANRQVLILGSQTQDLDGTFCVDVVVPAGFTSWQIQMVRACTTVGTGYSQIAQIGVYNLTALGLV